MTYIHGSSPREQQRLIDQAERFDGLLTANLELHPGERLLEIGCGVGAVLARIARAHPEAKLCGIDINPEQIDGARRHLAGQGLAGIELVVGNGAALPWSDGHMDRVRLVWVIEHLADPQPVLAEALRVLRPGGSIHLTETDYSSLRVVPANPAIEALLAAFVTHFNRHGNAQAGPQLGRLLEQAGFTDVAVTMVGIHHWCPGQSLEVQAFCSYLLGFITPELAALESAAGSAADAALIRRGHKRLAQLAECPDAAISLTIYQARAQKPQADRQNPDQQRATTTPCAQQGGTDLSVLAPVSFVPAITLESGAAMPALGLGTWKAATGEVGAAVRTALELGYRHIDCASIYGNEAEVGAALAAGQASGLVTREALWITSKLWNDCHAPEQVRPALERTLSDLQLEQLDLYLIHWPVVHRHGVLMPSNAADQIALEQLPLSATWAAMEALVEAGLVREIGVSNSSASKLKGLLPSCRIRPAMNQLERHPWLQQNDLLTFCRQQGIAITAYSPLGSPAADGPAPLLSEPVIRQIAAAHGASPAQVLLAWGISTGTAVIPKSVQRERLAENLAAAQLKLTKPELAQIAALDRQHRFVDGSFWELPGGPYNRETLWNEPG